MLWSKMQCTQCEHYKTCPLKTRLFVNYCGSRSASLAKDIEAALNDCKARRKVIVTYRRPSRFRFTAPTGQPQGNRKLMVDE